MANVDFGGVIKQVCLEFVPDVRVGEYTIVHVGFALQRLDEKSAMETLDLFRQMGELDMEFGDAWARAAQGIRSGGDAMKYLDEFSDPDLAKRLVDEIHATATRQWAIMEVCGGQTHTIIRHGIDQLLRRPGRDDPRPRLPGLRHAAGDHRQGARDRRRART